MGTNTKVKFWVQCKETGDKIELCNSYEEADNVIRGYEEADKQDGIYEPNFYEIKGE